ncbi:hypothetical protein FNF31_04688 [Cafeteria roenbergensis]|uniref:Glycosyl transferase family 1 domain-containing protein n=1 Tax=Cafeteria roenbergensis TaxID=33653 RepID=A0A5A8CLB2_CAFRO|nr:hypothetical protein FNF28_06922 [Cafeteria roenbergensis]KAA0159887.1 hypothetical protein FNF31_04688 [Cafeteria roenbergensis]
MPRKVPTFLAPTVVLLVAAALLWLAIGRLGLFNHWWRSLGVAKAGLPRLRDDALVGVRAAIPPQPPMDTPRYRGALESVHSAGVARLARLSGASERELAASGLAEVSMPFVRCEEQYSSKEVFRMLAECLPFAPRGALLMVNAEGTTLAQCKDDLGLALALGRAGFLVVLSGQAPWPCAPYKAGVEDFVRVGPSAYVQSRVYQIPAIVGDIGRDDLVPAPVLLMGSPTSSGEQLDADALHRSGSRVVVVAREGEGWSDSAARSGASDDEAFLLWAVCRSSVSAVVMRHAGGAAALADVPCNRAVRAGPGAAASRVALLSPTLAAGTDGSVLERHDAEAAQLAALLGSMPPLGGWSDAVGEAGGAGPGARTPAAASDSGQAATSAAAGEGAASAGSLGDAAATGEGSGPTVLAGSGDRPLLTVPLVRAACAEVHGTALNAWLLRCLPGRRGLFVQSHTIRWDMMLFQRPQHMARAMANRNALVLYVGLGRVLGLLKQAPGAPGVFLADPALKLDAIAGGAVITLYSTMHWLEPDAAARLEAAGNVAVYEYIDAIDSAITHGNSPRLVALRDQSSASASVVVYTAAALRPELRAPRPGAQLAFVPNGVYPPMFDVASDAPVPDQVADLVQSGRPTVGYFGAVANWIWQELVVEVARAVPEADFLIIGPAYPPATIPAASTLPRNLRYLGGVPAQDLVLFARHWSVGIIPFRHGDIARTTSPLKLFEYFALGLPVVVTDNMVECTKFDVVRKASEPPEFAAQVRAALRDFQDENLRSRIRLLAEANSWDRRADALLAAVGRAAASRRP